MLRSLPYIILAVTVYLVLLYMVNYQPQTVTNILIRVDIFGITRTVKEENDRLSSIKDLSIPFEEKQVLIDHTVFMGCSSDMAKLAIGEPKKVVERQMVDANKNVIQTLTYYIYFLPNDKRPTILVFSEDKLINAYKDSALNWGVK